MDNILIYLEDPVAYWQYVAEVLEYLWKHKLFMKLFKCKFSIDMVDFLGFILETKGIVIEQSQVQTIQK